MMDLLILTVAMMFVWLAVLTLVVLGHARRLELARKRIALGLPPFPKAPDDGRDNYLDRMGIS